MSTERKRGLPQPPVIVDTRGEDETVDVVSRENLTVIPRFLDCGDLMWFAEGFQCVLGVERKRADDLVNSLPPSDRLEGQLRRMLDTYPLPILLVQGDVSRHLDHLQRMQVECHWSKDGIDDYLLSWQLAGIFVVHCSADGLGQRIRLLYNWSQRRTHLQPRRTRKLLWTGPSTGRAEALAALVPGLGLARAQELSQQMSMQQLSSLTEEGWKNLKMKGLGSTMKKRLHEALTTEDV